MHNLPHQIICSISIFLSYTLLFRFMYTLSSFSLFYVLPNVSSVVVYTIHTLFCRLHTNTYVWVSIFLLVFYAHMHFGKASVRFSILPPTWPQFWQYLKAIVLLLSKLRWEYTNYCQNWGDFGTYCTQDLQYVTDKINNCSKIRFARGDLLRPCVVKIELCTYTPFIGYVVISLQFS